MSGCSDADLLEDILKTLIRAVHDKSQNISRELHTSNISTLTGESGLLDPLKWFEILSAIEKFDFAIRFMDGALLASIAGWIEMQETSAYDVNAIALRYCTSQRI